MQLITYARQYFQPLAAKHEREIQSLMGSLLYLKVGLENSPYNYLLDSLSWSEICDIFTRDAALCWPQRRKPPIGDHSTPAASLCRRSSISSK